MIEINIIIVVLPVGVEAVDTTATLILALLPRRNLATRVMMFIAICARDSKARKGRRGIGRLYEGAEGRNSRGTHATIQPKEHPTHTRRYDGALALRCSVYLVKCPGASLPHLLQECGLSCLQHHRP